MSLEKLLGDGWIKRIEPAKDVAEKSLRLARRDLEAAENNLEKGDDDWALVIAYSAMLNAGRALMFAKGYQPTGEYKHLSVTKFLEETPAGAELVRTFDQLRKKRNQVVYDEPDIVSEGEARDAVGEAINFVDKVEKMLSG